MQFLAIPHECKSIAPNPIGRRLYDGESDSSCQRCVDGIAPQSQNFYSSLHCQGLAGSDDSALRDYAASMRSVGFSQ
jgi:hypothetical protein